MNVNAFVSKTKAIFNNLAKHRIVIGNQSADLDSIVSALSMSLYLTHKNNQEYIPVINSNKTILQSKKECMFLFDYFSINFDDLIFVNDLKSKQILDVTLVDHNELDEQETKLDFFNLVNAVVDHHLDKSLFMNANPRIVDTTAGSNATLIANLFKTDLDLNESFASMLIFPILFDTNNLTNRASQKDHEMVKYLNGLCQINCDSIYKKLDDIRFSSGADEATHIILSKDYKQYSATNDIKWGMSSINCEVNKWLDANNRVEEIFEFINQKDLDFLGILSIYKQENGDFKRDLGLFTKKASILTRIQNPNLTLIKMIQTESIEYSVHSVSEVTLTRKFWQPFLEQFLKSL